jgi:hypothetical protein
MISPRQEQVLDILATKDMTAAEIATELKSETKATSKHLRLLEEMGKIFVCEWRKGKHNVLTKVYRLGKGESAVIMSKKKPSAKQNEARKAANKRNIYDPYAPLATNNGWRSTIHSKDYSMQHGEHIKFMERFQPHPDHASVWLFNEPRVELLGAKYD